MNFDGPVRRDRHGYVHAGTDAGWKPIGAGIGYKRLADSNGRLIAESAAGKSQLVDYPSAIEQRATFR